MGLSLTETTIEGFEALAVDAGDVQLVVLPRLGAKVLSLVWKPTGYEYLWRQPDRALRLAEYGADFEAGDISGWDECFPTIGQAVYPEYPWTGVVAPDHGELWSLPWSWSVDGDTLRMRTEGVRFPYRFERSFSFARPGCLDVNYAVANRAPYHLRALWSMHPFFRVAPDTRILLPEPTRIRIEVSKSSRLGGFLAEHPWPMAKDRAGQSVDMSQVGPLDSRFMEKVFTDRLAVGWAALFTPSHQQFVALQFDASIVPYIGLAIMRGGWPDEGIPSSSVILEPCTGWPDRLDIAIPRGDAMRIAAKSTVRWEIAIHLGTGRDVLDGVLSPTR